MSKIFSVYASNGLHNYVELDLPASDYEMLDLMERLRLEPGKPPYLEILEYHAFEFLEKCIAELPGCPPAQRPGWEIVGNQRDRCAGYGGL